MGATLDSVIERFYSLTVGVTGRVGERHERPHKPLLLLSVFDLLDAGLALPDRVPWNRTLRDRFAHYFALVRKHNDRTTPEYPFEHLAGDGFWQTYRITAKGEEQHEGEVRIRDTGELFARFVDGVEFIVASAENRQILRAALVSRYFPRVGAAALNAPALREFRKEANRTEAEDVGRSAGFRRAVVEAYDHQCAACGLRIRIAGADTSFVDAAHLIPFAESQNDHPTNGIALCKNHHWAMDRFLIAPSPERLWRVSRHVISRRSSGEAELAGLESRPVLPALDEAFAPDRDALEWRFARLLA